MLSVRSNEFSVAAAVVILLADVALANVIVQPGYGQPTTYHPSLQPTTVSHEEAEVERRIAHEQNVHYGHQYPPAEYYPSEGQPRSFGHQPHWQNPHAVPLPHANVPKIVHPLHVTKIGGYGYHQPTYIVGHPQYPPYAVPESRRRRSADEKDTGNGDAVAPNPTVTNISTKLSGQKDGKLEDLQTTPIEETDETRQKREKRIDTRQVYNGKVGDILGLNSEKMQPGYHQYRPDHDPTMIQQTRRSQFLPPKTVQPKNNKVTREATSLREKELLPAASLRDQQAFAEDDDDAQSESNEDKKQQTGSNKKSEKTNSSSKTLEEKSRHQSEPEIIIHNVPSQPVKRQDGLFNVNINSGNTEVSEDYPNYPTGGGPGPYSGPSGPSGPSGSYYPDAGWQGDVSVQSDFMVGSTQRCHKKPCCGQRNFPDPRPHTHNKGHECNTYTHPRQDNQKVTTASNNVQKEPVAQNVVESANTCDCQRSIVQPYSLSNSFYIVPIRPVQPLYMNRLNMLGCNDMNGMLGRAQQVYQLPQEQTDPQPAQAPAARYTCSQCNNYVPSYRSAYAMPYYGHSSPYYAQCGCGGTQYV